MLKQLRADVLGPILENMGTSLNILSQVYKTDSCQEELEKDFLSVFPLLNNESVAQYSGSYDNTQKKRLEKLMADARAKATGAYNWLRALIECGGSFGYVVWN